MNPQDLPLLWLTLPRRYDRGHFFWKHNVQRWPHLRWLKVEGADPVNHGFRPHGLVQAQTPGQLGAWLTHYFAWQIALATGAPAVCIFEDDVRLADDWLERLPQDLPCCHDVYAFHLGDPKERGLYAYMVGRGRLKDWLELHRARLLHIDHQVWQTDPLDLPAGEPLARHCSDELLSETCTHTWETYHTPGRP
jgi:hypothetical protein